MWEHNLFVRFGGTAFNALQQLFWPHLCGEDPQNFNFSLTFEDKK